MGQLVPMSPAATVLARRASRASVVLKSFSDDGSDLDEATEAEDSVRSDEAWQPDDPMLDGKTSGAADGAVRGRVRLHGGVQAHSGLDAEEERRKMLWLSGALCGRS